MSREEAIRYLQIAEHDYCIGRFLARGPQDNPTSPEMLGDTTDWQIALLYYTLCLEVKALGSSRGFELQNRYELRQWLNSEQDVIDIAKPYRKAEEWSRDARYEGRVFSRQELVRFGTWFNEVHTRVCKLLTATGLSVPSAIDPSTIVPDYQ